MFSFNYKKKLLEGKITFNIKKVGQGKSGRHAILGSAKIKSFPHSLI